MQVRAIIRNARMKKKMSLRSLAKAVRVNPAYLSRIEAGKVNASEEILQKIGKKLGLAVDRLLLEAGHLTPELQSRLLKTVWPDSATALREEAPEYGKPRFVMQGKRAIEGEDFPFEHLSEIAEMESWRKELNRPVYHLHKWWAQRLGSVFRAIILGSFSPDGTDILRKFYEPLSLEHAVVFDPFMGSGTTVGEALKVGARAIGRDINPVAAFSVRTALRPYSRDEVLSTFRLLQSKVAASLQRYYQVHLPDGGLADVLYYFWVMVADCPACGRSVDLFSSFVFATNHHPDKKTAGYAVCPWCGALDAVNRQEKSHRCQGCRKPYNLEDGPAKGAGAECPECKHLFTIAKCFQTKGAPPEYRVYAKLVLMPDGSKEYLPADQFDRELFASAKRDLQEGKHPFPAVRLAPGSNTNQAINYCFTHWNQFFNARQLLCLSLLGQAIRGIEKPALRELFTCLLSGCLEFNNMFASYKGEGTGAVRHMFSHHILKPERTPLEANLWGTPRSSGAFSTLFESRVLRALEYKSDPFELRVAHRNGRAISEKVYGLNRALNAESGKDFTEFATEGCLYLSCGDSSQTDIATGSVDAVITDPPFFDNVHYSELADFFYSWQAFFSNGMKVEPGLTTRQDGEVQHTEAGVFTERLASVWRECGRVLRDDGLLVFTYHHSRPDGWGSVLRALLRADFQIVATHPIKAEMSVASPKHQTKEPIDVDVIIVCRRVVKRPGTEGGGPRAVVSRAVAAAAEQIRRFNGCGRVMGKGDVRVILNAQLLRLISGLGEEKLASALLDECIKLAPAHVESLCSQQQVRSDQPKEESVTLELALA
jgi:transcriptional regulator with XRE-family HTH domain/DNA-directed RNA polymerase subunit RPC12/RpoP